MIEALQAALDMFLSWQNMAAMGVGMMIGVTIGCIPGLNGAMGVALVLPFTFYLPPITGILMLTALYKGAIYGGSISAILIKTPGTSAAACTVMDGYAMTLKGQAGKALYMALYASVVADFISNLSLIFFTGFVASAALRFGPPEFFSLILFSLTVVAGVSGGSLTKGLLAGCMGLLIATIGMDGVQGTSRFSFYHPDVMAGINFIPMMIGLFAFPEIVDAYVGKDQVTKKATASVNDSRVTMADFKRCFVTILRGSGIGVVLGAMPGIGGTVAAFVAYGDAKRRSKHPETFGEGELEGVAAAESGNNGTCGAAMVPLLALGVPGDMITGIILGAFMMHGIMPGPLLFQNELPLIYALYMGIMISSLLMLCAGVFCIRAFSRVSNVSKKYLFPVVMVLCFFGAYATNNSMFDVLVMVLFGILGHCMRLMTIPVPPLVIAVLLGPLFEDNLRRALLMSSGDFSIFLRSPISLTFLALFVISIIFMIRKQRMLANC